MGWGGVGGEGYVETRVTASACNWSEIKGCTVN